MDSVTSKQIIAFVETGWEEGGCAVEGQAMVARVSIKLIRVRSIEVRLHGERLIYNYDEFPWYVDLSALGDGKS